MSESIQGIHHLTGIAGDAQRNLGFYTRVLGLRLVKRTVNFDDPGTYHFYFADETGTPGTIMTFFPWAQAKRGTRGLGQVAVVGFSVPADTLGYWKERLEGAGTSVSAPFRRFDEEVLTFLDPDGLQLELAARDEMAALPAWEGGPVPAQQAIRGFSAPTLLLANAEGSANLLAKTFGLRQIDQQGPRMRFRGEASSGSLVDIEVRPNEQRGRMGPGVMHHIAWRTRDDQSQLEWREKLIGLGYEVTPVMDRQYFHSIYFREPGGVLFEIATDPPGFTLDETVEELGHALRLPPWLESRRAEIEGILPPLTFDEPRHKEPGRKEPKLEAPKREPTPRSEHQKQDR